MNTSQRGSGHLFSLLVIALIVWGGYVTLYVPYEHKQSMEAFRGKPPVLSPAKLALVEAYRDRPAPGQVPHGLYSGSTEQDGYTLTISFDFADDGLITKRARIKDYRFDGSASYGFAGSTLTFARVKGDAVLFPEAGEPIEVISVDEIHVPGPDTTLVLRRE